MAHLALSRDALQAVAVLNKLGKDAARMPEADPRRQRLDDAVWNQYGVVKRRAGDKIMAVFVAVEAEAREILGLRVVDRRLVTAERPAARSGASGKQSRTVRRATHRHLSYKPA